MARIHLGLYMAITLSRPRDVMRSWSRHFLRLPKRLCLVDCLFFFFFRCHPKFIVDDISAVKFVGAIWTGSNWLVGRQETAAFWRPTRPQPPLPRSQAGVTETSHTLNSLARIWPDLTSERFLGRTELPLVPHIDLDGVSNDFDYFPHTLCTKRAGKRQRQRLTYLTARFAMSARTNRSSKLDGTINQAATDRERPG